MHWAHLPATLRAPSLTVLPSLSTRGKGALLSAALSVLDGQRPKDEIEAQLVIQMAVTHAYAMDLMGRSKRSEFLEHLEAFGRLAQPPAADLRPAVRRARLPSSRWQARCGSAA